MTDMTQINEALDQLTTKHVSEMAVKADQTAVTEAVEAVKAEAVEATAAVHVELEAAKAASAELLIKHEELEAKFAALPTIQKEETPMTTHFESTTNAQGAAMFGKSFNTFTKAVAEGDSITGSRTDAQSPYFILEQQSVFRGEAMVINTGAGVIQLPSISGVTWNKENTVIQDGSRANGGSIATAQVVVNNWTTQNMISLPALEDIQDFDGMMVKLIAQKLATAENVEAAAVLKAGVVKTVKTGAATALPAQADIVAKMDKLIEECGTAYLAGAKFYVSRAVYSLIASSNNNTLNFDPTTKVMTVHGYPIVTVDALDAGNGAGHVSAYFGNMNAALAFVSRKTMDVTRMDQYAPGNMTYFGDSRFAFSAYDITTSLVGLKTQA